MKKFESSLGYLVRTRLAPDDLATGFAGHVDGMHLNDSRVPSIAIAERLKAGAPSPSYSLYLTALTNLAFELALDQLSFGLAVVDEELRVLALNRSAQTLIDSGQGVTMLEDRLACRDGRAHQKMERLIKRQRELAADEHTPAVMRVSRASGCTDLYLSISAIAADSLTHIVECKTIFCIWIFDTTAQKQLSVTLLRDLHGLTLTEAQVAASLFCGTTIESAATSLGISINTVKTHLKHIFQKCEVRSQAELLQMLALGPR